MTGRAIGTRLAIAQARAEAARTRLSGTIAALQQRSRPTSLVHDVTTTLKEHGTDIALRLVDTAKRRPARTGAIVVAIGLFLGRHQVAALMRRATGPSRPSSAKSINGKSKP